MAKIISISNNGSSRQRRSSSQRSWCSVSFLMRFFFTVNVCIFCSVTVCFGFYYNYHYHNFLYDHDENYNTAITTAAAWHSQQSLFSPKAYPVYGTHAEFEWNKNNQGNNNEKDSTISVVYAIPPPVVKSSSNSNNDDGRNFVIRSFPSSSSSSPYSSLSSSSSSSTTSRDNKAPININGIVILLHACSHNAFKFFSPSSSCPDCVGLSEELQLTRHVLDRGYVALAVTCSNVKSGCWGGDDDVDRVRTAVDEFVRIHSIISERHEHAVVSVGDGDGDGDKSNNNNNNHNHNNNNKVVTIHAIGASSGGFMAAKLMTEGIADSAVVMVMGLRNQLLDKLLLLGGSNNDSSTDRTTTAAATRRRLYFAPMTKDKGTAKRVRENYQYLLEHQQQQQYQQQFEVILDETSCRPLPVTVDYLWNRVPGMTKEASKIIVDSLLENKHLDPTNKFLIVDPTKSNWRDYLLHPTTKIKGSRVREQQQVPKSLRIIIQPQQQQVHNVAAQTSTSTTKQKSNKMLLWGTFDLTPGVSPLAKALHRAWAMHEYCSESVIPAIDFFENKRTKKEVEEMILLASGSDLN